MQMELLFADDEDEFDALVEDVQDDIQNDDASLWTDCVQESLDGVIDQIYDFDKKASDLAEAMWNVVLEERKLAEKEEAERKSRRSEKRIPQGQISHRSEHNPDDTDPRLR